MNSDNGVGFGQYGRVRTFSGGFSGMQPDRDTFERLVGSLMRGIAQTREQPCCKELLETVKSLSASGRRAFFDNDPESLIKAYDSLKNIRLY